MAVATRPFERTVSSASIRPHESGARGRRVRLRRRPGLRAPLEAATTRVPPGWRMRTANRGRPAAPEARTTRRRQVARPDGQRLLTARARIVPRRLPEAECESRAPAAPVCGPLVRVVQLRLRSQAVARSQSGRAALAA